MRACYNLHSRETFLIALSLSCSLPPLIQSQDENIGELDRLEILRE